MLETDSWSQNVQTRRAVQASIISGTEDFSWLKCHKAHQYRPYPLPKQNSGSADPTANTFGYAGNAHPV
jgi:hypothetical protein